MWHYQNFECFSQEEWNVENMIEGINDKFAHYMEDIGYNGKVRMTMFVICSTLI